MNSLHILGATLIILVTLFCIHVYSVGRALFSRKEIRGWYYIPTVEMPHPPLLPTKLPTVQHWTLSGPYITRIYA